MVDGPFTIPLMKRTGFRPAFAAAVEAVASTGGQLMPPIMGAAAFVMAEFLAVSYAQVALWALLPAVLYYVAVFIAVHFEAKRIGLMGLPTAELPRFGAVLLERGHLFLPLILIMLFVLLAGYSAPLCALAGALVLPAARAAAPVHARRHRLASRCSRRSRTAPATRWPWRWPAPAPASSSACVTLTGLGIVFTQWCWRCRRTRCCWR